jgi:hypothetical protein
MVSRNIQLTSSVGEKPSRLCISPSGEGVPLYCSSLATEAGNSNRKDDNRNTKETEINYPETILSVVFEVKKVCYVGSQIIF